MRQFIRLPCPPFLAENAARWNEQWDRLKRNNPGATFQWYHHDKSPVNQLLAPILAQQTQNHCSYCDAFPLGIADETIDHFKPKGTEAFYGEAYSWQNLYWACADCQFAKREKFDHLLLSPDEVGYSFGAVFCVQLSYTRNHPKSRS